MSNRAAAALAFSNELVVRHTDIVLVVDTKKSVAAGLASCVLIRAGRKQWAISCHHVLEPNAAYFIGPGRLERDLIPEEPPARVLAARLVASDEDLDLALFEIKNDMPAARSKESYDLRASAAISHDGIRRNLELGVTAFLCGLYARRSRIKPYPDGLLYLQAPLYSALGPLVSVDKVRVVGDFAEKELLFVNDTAFPQLKGAKPTGGPRRVHGISGSGMWVMGSGRMHLLGIVGGRDPGSRGEHLIHATPVWALRSWLHSVT